MHENAHVGIQIATSSTVDTPNCHKKGEKETSRKGRFGGKCNEYSGPSLNRNPK